MTEHERVVRWLGTYFLGTTAVLGAYILLFNQTKLLPIPKEDAASAFAIIIPTLIAQLTAVFKWVSMPKYGVPRLSIPMWAITGPPTTVIGILLMTITFLIFDGGNSDTGTIFKNVVTFCVSILSASTVFVVSAVFGTTTTTEASNSIVTDAADAKKRSGELL